MKEKNQSPHEQLAGGGGLGGMFDDPSDDGELVMVASGPYAEQLPVANRSVGEIRARFRDRFDIDPRSQAILSGHEVGDDTRLQPGQVLMFVRRAGEKGLRKTEVRNPRAEIRNRIQSNAPVILPSLSLDVRSDFGFRISVFF